MNEASATKAPIYVIDDDSAVLESTAFLLGAYGLDCVTFPTAMHFLARLEGLEPGCIITDLRMPEIDGWALIAHLRKGSVDWPAVLMSSERGDDLTSRAAAAGFTQFIRKPVDGELLIEAVRHAQAEVAEISDRA